MARTVTRAMQNYPAGTYGPFAVDGFTRNNARAIQLRLTFENLTADALPVGRIELKWDVESETRTQVVERPSSAAVDKAGVPNPTVTYTFGIPRVAGERLATTGGDVTFVVTTAIRCSLVAEAI